MNNAQGQTLLKLKLENDSSTLYDDCSDESLTDLQEIEFEMVMPIDFADKRKMQIHQGITEVDERLTVIDEKVEKLNSEIDRLTNQADKVDYSAAVICGLITGIIDSIFVGEWNFKNAKAKANQDVNNMVISFAKKDPTYLPWCNKNGKDQNRLASAIQFLEGKYKLPGDGNYKFVNNSGITSSTHHLDDFCHHPTLIGLVCCVIVQFTGSVKYHGAFGVSDKIPVTVNKYGNFVSDNTWGKVFSGIINWFFTVAKTIQNRKGHLMSDIAGSSSSVKDGAGLPGTFMSTMKELASLPIFKDTMFSENLRKAYQNGIGTNKGIDLGPFNALFEGAASKFDMRTEMAVMSELKRQAFPVILNEILVRAFYFVRRFIKEMKEKESLSSLNWKNVLPIGNRTIVRMMTIATGTFTAVDLVDALIRAVIKSGGINPATLANFILRVNFVGVGRFAIAVGTDVGMCIKKCIKENERIKLQGEQLQLLNAKIFYKEADMWIEAENTQQALNEVYVIMNKTATEFVEAWKEIASGSEKRGEYAEKIRQNNPDFVGELLIILE